MNSHKNLNTKLDSKNKSEIGPKQKAYPNRKASKINATKCKLLQRVRHDAHQVQTILFLIVEKLFHSFRMR